MKQIIQYEEITSMEDDDWLLVQPKNGGLYKKIKKSNLLKGLTASSNSSSSTITLTYQNFGDNNGVFFFIGSNRNTSAWVNPQLSGAISISAISYYPGAANPHFLVSRTNENDISTNPAANPWFLFDLKNYKLKISAYTILGRTRDGQNPRSWIIQGSNDGNTFIDLHIVNDNPINNNEWKLLQLPATTTQAYNRYIRFWQTQNTQNTPYLTMGEIEFYGSLEWV